MPSSAASSARFEGMHQHAAPMSAAPGTSTTDAIRVIEERNMPVDPRRAYRRHQRVALTSRAAARLGERLDERMRSHGRLSETDLARH